MTTTFCPRMQRSPITAPRHDVAEVPDLGVRADACALVDVRRLVDRTVASIRASHSSPLRPFVRTVAQGLLPAVAESRRPRSDHRLPFLQRPDRAGAERSAMMASPAALAADIVVV